MDAGVIGPGPWQRGRAAAGGIGPAVRAPLGLRGKEGTQSGRDSDVRNVETVRHEALHDRAEVKGLRRRVVAATRLELREA